LYDGLELSNHLIFDNAFDSAFGSVAENEMNLAAKRVSELPDNSLTLFDKGFYSLGLLYDWQQKGHDTHWLRPLKRGTQYEEI
jgi:hypothetical protein